MKHIDEGLWCASDELKMPLGAAFSLRMTVLRADDGRLLLHSPVKMDDALAGEIEGLGGVGHILAPNLFHHLYAPRAMARFAEAELTVPTGIAEKNARLAGGTAIAPGAEREVAPGILALGGEGTPSVNEIALFHGVSKTLVLTDLVFNVQDPPGGFMTSVILHAFGAHKKLAQSRAFRLVTKDREAARRSAERLLELPFERVVMSHGDIIEHDAKDRLAAAWRWMLGRPKT